MQIVESFTEPQMKAIKRVVDYAASCCGGGEDTIGAFIYTACFREEILDTKNNPDAIVNLAEIIDKYENLLVKNENLQS
jgi:hypothetical protein